MSAFYDHCQRGLYAAWLIGGDSSIPIQVKAGSGAARRGGGQGNVPSVTDGRTLAYIMARNAS